LFAWFSRKDCFESAGFAELVNIDGARSLRRVEQLGGRSRAEAPCQVKLFLAPKEAKTLAYVLTVEEEYSLSESKTAGKWISDLLRRNGNKRIGKFPVVSLSPSVEEFVVGNNKVKLFSYNRIKPQLYFDFIKKNR